MVMAHCCLSIHLLYAGFHAFREGRVQVGRLTDHDQSFVAGVLLPAFYYLSRIFMIGEVIAALRAEDPAIYEAYVASTYWIPSNPFQTEKQLKPIYIPNKNSKRVCT
jgi:hypothetical protein